MNWKALTIATLLFTVACDVVVTPPPTPPPAPTPPPVVNPPMPRPTPTPAPTHRPHTIKFKVGDRVRTTGATNVRATPNGTIRGSQPEGSFGTVVGGHRHANGFIWWKIDYETGADGWSAEHLLDKSTVKFRIGDRVRTTAAVRVRQSPNGDQVGSQPQGALGMVINGPVKAGSHVWYRINYDTGVDGWSAEQYLTKSTAPKPDPNFNGIPGVIEVFSPRRNQFVCNDGSITVTGKARGWWYFEATFPVTVRDVHGQPIGQHYAEAQSDWMTDEFVEFKGVIPFREAQGLSGTIVFHKDNPSGLPENDRSYEMPVRFDNNC